MTDGTTDVSTPEMEQATTDDSNELETLRREKEEAERKYKELQSDYTRKSQELSTLKKAPQVEHTPEEAQLKERIAKE